MNQEQLKAYKSLKRAIKKCDNAKLGVGMEDYGLYVADYEYATENFKSPWHFLREHNSDEEKCLFIDSRFCLGAGGA